MTSPQELSKGRLFLALAAIFLSSMCTLGDLVITPIAGNLYTAFGDAPEAIINFAITGPALVGLPFCFISGWLCDRFDKKWVLTIGFAIFTFSAVFGAVITDIYVFTTLRCLATGVGWGLTNSAAFAILADMYNDNEDKHGKMVGWYNSAMSVMGAILASVAGVLAVSAWQNAFQAYWIAVPVLVMLIVFVPAFKPTNKAEADADKPKAHAADEKGWWKRLVPLNIQIFLIAVCYFVAMYMLSLYVADAGVGDEAFTGMLSSVMTIATAIGSLAFGFFYAKMKNAVYLPAVVLMGLAFILMGLFPNQAIAIAGCAVLGLFWPFYFCYFYAYCTELVPAHRAGTATGIVALSDGLAAAACSYLVVGLMDATGMSCVQVWPLFGVALLAIAVVSAVAYFAKHKKNA